MDDNRTQLKLSLLRKEYLEKTLHPNLIAKNMESAKTNRYSQVFNALDQGIREYESLNKDVKSLIYN